MTHSDPFADYAAQVRDFIRRRSPAAPHSPSLEAEFNRLALGLFSLQFARNAPYGQFCQARKVAPQTIENWTQIPALPAVAFKEFEITCLAPAERTRVFHSSGTTGQRPSRHFHNHESLAIYEASLLPWFAAHLLPENPVAAGQPGLEILQAQKSFLPLPRGEGRGEGRGNSNRADVSKPSATNGRCHFLALTPPPEQAPNSSLVHMFETIRRAFGSTRSSFTGVAQSDGSWNLDLDKTLKVLRESIAHTSPLILLGTAFSYVHLLDHLQASGARLQLPAGLRALETGGYKGRSRTMPKTELHQLITDWLGIPGSEIVCEYGMSEMSSQAYDSVAGARVGARRFHFPPWARAQIISPETGRQAGEGETGLIRVFDLANVYSVMAIQTEDLGVRRDDGFELLGRATVSEPRGCSLQLADQLSA